MLPLTALLAAAFASVAQDYQPVKATRTGRINPHSPDPVMDFVWPHPQADDELETYVLKPRNAKAVITVKDTGEMQFDFGQTNAGWIEFDSDDLEDSVLVSISEFNQPGVFNEGSTHRHKTLAPTKHGHTYRLELNAELYEGVRYAWLHVKTHRHDWHLNNFRLVCQVKPVNYRGSFACSDTMLTRIWYTGAYTVKLNLLKDYIGAILMERQDRFSWTGDAYVSQAAAMAAFGNYDFVRKNIRHTSGQDNGIASYALYWVLSLIDYANYSGDTAFVTEYLDNARAKLDRAYAIFGTSPKLGFFGWDERLGAGFENASLPESQYAYEMLSIRCWREFAGLMRQMGRNALASQYGGYAEEKMAVVRKEAGWTQKLGAHASADAVNTGLTTATEQAALYRMQLRDRINRLSFSPFNEYFIIDALARMGRQLDGIHTIRDCWGGQIRYGGTSFFENYRPSWNAVVGKNGPLPNNQCGYTSLTHPWSAGVTKWLSEQVLGIRPLEPGFKRFEIVPNLGDTMSYVSGTTPTVEGAIVATFNINTGRSRVEVPAGTMAARVAIPVGANKVRAVFVNGKRVDDAKVEGMQEKGMQDEAMHEKGMRDNAMHEKVMPDAGYLVLKDLGPGRYEVTVQYGSRVRRVAAPELPWNYTITKFSQTTTGNYGKDGYVLFGEKDTKKLPPYVDDVVMRLEGRMQLNDTLGAVFTRDPLPCLETMTMDVRIKDSAEHQLAIYMLDWDRKGRVSAIEVFDGNDYRLLAPVQVVRSYEQGKYLVFKFRGSLRLRIDEVRGDNALVNRLFFN